MTRGSGDATAPDRQASTRRGATPRLALVRQRYTPFGGAEVFVERAIAALRARGVSITIVTRQWAGASREGVDLLTVDPTYLGRRSRQQTFERAVCARLAAERGLLVQSHERIPCCDIYRAGDGVHAVWLEEKTREASSLARKLTYLDPFHRYALDAEQRLYASPRLKSVICISRMVQDEVHARFGVARERLPVIYNAIDATRFHPGLRAGRETTLEQAGIVPDRVVFLLLGSGYARKGVANAIRALARVRGDAHLLVVGKEPRAARYRALARRLDVSDRVTFAGPQADPRPWYGAADVFLLPTLYDPLSNAVLEAMACGLPVITSTRCGAGEIVREHGAGMVCAAQDVAAIAAAMTARLDVSVRRREGEAARRAVMPLTPEAMSGQLLALYERLLA